MRRINGAKRPLGIAIFIACLAVALVTAFGAQATPGMDVAVNVTPSFNEAAFTVTSTAATKLEVDYGADYAAKQFDGLKTTHSFMLPDLKPNTKYYCRLKLTSLKGKSTSRPCDEHGSSYFTTSPPQPAVLAVKDGLVTLGGVPTILIIAKDMFCPTADDVSSYYAIGADVIQGVSDGCSPAVDFQAVLAHQAWWMEHDPGSAAQATGVPNGLELVWPQNVEVRQSDSFVGCVGRPFAVQYDQLKTFPELRTGWMFYPNGHLNNCTNVAGHPAWIETLWWSEIMTGIRSIFVSGVDPGVQAKLKQLADRTATLQPCILAGKPIKATTPKGSSLRVSAWQYGGMTCAFAINTSNKPVTGTFSLSGMGATKVASVPWEKHRTVKVAPGGRFNDKFASLITHIYISVQSAK